MVKIQEKYTYQYPHPSLTADAVLFGYGNLEEEGSDNELHILLIERGLEPYKGMMALPGGFLNLIDDGERKEDEDMETCVRRELHEETGLEVPFMNEFGVFSQKDRDPRVDKYGLKERVITVAFYGFVRMKEFKEVQGGDDARLAQWVPLKKVLNDTPLAFDHKQIISKAIERLREEIHFKPIAFNIVDKEFTIDQLRKVYEAVLDIELDRGNFRKKILNLGYVKDTGKRNTGSAHRSPFLYEFDEEAYNRTKDYREYTDNNKRKIGKRLEF